IRFPAAVPGQGRQDARGGRRRPGPRARRAIVPGAARPGAVPVRRSRGNRAARRLGRRERVSPRGDGRGRLGEGDFRTWAATVRAAELLDCQAIPATATERKRVVLETVAAVARELGNTGAVCRRSFIHPLVIEAFERGTTLPQL